MEWTGGGGPRTLESNEAEIAHVLHVDLLALSTELLHLLLEVLHVAELGGTVDDLVATQSDMEQERTCNHQRW